jgi:hypothetical protein
MLSLPLEKKLHRKITTRWRNAMPYKSKKYKDITKVKMIKLCEEVYYDMLALKDAAIRYVKNIINNS